MSVRVVGVRFKKAGKVYYFDPVEIPLQQGQHVVVETTRGIEYGEVVVAPRDVPDEEVVAPLKQVLRQATPEDDQQVAENREKEQRAYEVALEKIALHQLPMKLISVEQTFDGNKIIFYFTADGRIDFRELVKDLAAVFRTRIELRQIGVRDEAKMVGGLGCCGRELCCSSWLADFAPVSIRMAKEQNLSLNPTKISGICGRLMCCLKYENDVYEEAKAGYPDLGTQVLAPEGEGKIVAVNIFRNTVSVELQESKAIREYPLNELKIKKGRGECNCGCPARQN
ncbi:PSP1 domain protein [Desulforamulus reducens MI-1]|uniref:PSP1 domain protein n=1 Tax=Desulforamulus reducens (strain ATCC BAA-1160 / DSM 100696 / MI-1) TaxID=349161 RepID=A4J0K8_DESRM|nr:stage 0 sporulation family protein [Desulforamulus reducens]ABO48611.1 PSP1 domain protein [Desulforamulus reducens MI-1]